MSTILIETSEEDSTLAVAELVSQYLDGGKDKTALAETPGSKFLTACSGLLAEARFPELLELFLGNVEPIFSKASGKDLECCLLVICNMLPKLPAEAQVAAVLRTSSAFTAAASANSNKDSCLMALVELYNATFDGRARYTVFVQILKFARESSLLDEVIPIVKGKAAVFIADWKLPKDDARTLYLEIAAVLPPADREAFDLHVTYLKSFEGCSGTELASAQAVAAQTVADFIKSPDMFKCDIYDLAAVKQLESLPSHVGVYQLLSIMLAGDLTALAAFVKEHASVLSDCGITAEDATMKTRLMAVLGLGSKGSGLTEISFETVRDTLAIADDEVEQWIVMAIGKKLIEAKIDQLERSIQITRSTKQVFGAAQWKELQGQLAAWKLNLGNVAALVANAQVQAASMTG
mmetsp:Transcript_45349/g.116070  ORF Transcript_45349/g.116070 Transcript_45349/m.116070 type:complete len:407 (-) Transcript_45349:103-1323(-)